jgi:NAD(P)-dependent dehydrogenase (short-subunit alcohol dehydrogenase family)
MAGRLDGKVAVITGAASGIGRGTVDLFVAEGARVIAADIQDDKGARLAEDHKGNAIYVHCDVTQEKDVAAAIAAAKGRFGRLDVLFNNAGAGGARETADGVSAEAFDAVMHLHVRAAMFGIKYAAPIMKAQGGGSIVSTASVAGLRTGYGPYLYSVAKAAVIHLTHVAATELAQANIRVNCICPGLIATSIFGVGLGLPTQVADSAVKAIAEGSQNTQFIPRGGLPEDIAEAVLYLASDGSSFVTGHALVVDGGLTLGPSLMSQMMTFAPIAQALGIDMAALAAPTQKPS